MATISVLTRGNAVRADHVILLTRLPRWMCGSDKVLVSTFSIWRDGAHAIRLTPLVRS